MDETKLFIQVMEKHLLQIKQSFYRKRQESFHRDRRFLVRELLGLKDWFRKQGWPVTINLLDYVLVGVLKSIRIYGSFNTQDYFPVYYRKVLWDWVEKNHEDIWMEVKSMPSIANCLHEKNFGKMSGEEKMKHVDISQNMQLVEDFLNKKAAKRYEPPVHEAAQQKLKL